MTFDPAWNYWEWTMPLLIVSGVLLNIAIYLYLRKKEMKR